MPPKPTKTWYRVNSRQFYPPSGPIVLGAIITDYKNADNPLNENAIEPVTPEMLNRQPLDIESGNVTADSSKGGEMGVSTPSLAAFANLSLDVGVKIGSAATETMDCALVRTMEFRPTLAYVKKAVQAEGVQTYVNGHFFGRSIFLVTGVRTATDAKFGMDVQDEIGVRVAVKQADTVQLGGEMMVNKDSLSTSGTVKGEFVFAFRISKIVVSKGKPIWDGVRPSYTKHADLYGVDDGKMEEEFKQPDAFEVGVVRLVEEEMTAERLGVEGIVARDEDGQACRVVVG